MRARIAACFAGDVLHVAQPVVDQAERLAVERGAHAAAAVVADDDDVLDLQHVDRELQHREAVEVGVHDDVGDVAVDEQLARRETDDLVGRHAAVGAADPEVSRRLLLARVGEEIRIAVAQARGPRAVAFEQVFER